MRNVIVTLLLIVYASIGFYTAGAQTNCKPVLLKALSSAQKATSTTIYAEYLITTTYREEDAGLVKENSKASIWLNGSKSRFESDDFEILHDSLFEVAILKEEKKVLIKRSDESSYKTTQKLALSMIQDTLINRLTVTCCENILSPSGPDLLKIDGVIKTNGKGELATIDHVSFWINLKTGRISRMLMAYKSHPYDVIEIDLKIVAYDEQYVGEVFKNNAVARIYSPSNTLNPKYRDFEILDLRDRKIN